MSLAKLQAYQPDSAQWTERLTTLVQRLNAVAGCERVIVFGSFARRNMSLESDLDIAVVIGHGIDPRAFRAEVRRGGRLIDWPLDLFVVSASEFERRKEIGGICWEIASEGIELFPLWSLSQMSAERKD